MLKKHEKNPAANQQFQIISDWGIIKNFHRYNDACQVMYVDENIGDGYFENYDFGTLNLARLNCQFHKTHILTNPKSRQGYWIHIILQGKYKLSSIHVDTPYIVHAPCILLLKGEMGEMMASIASDMLIQSFYIEFDSLYFATLQQQLQHKPSYEDSILHHFFYQQEPYCCIPLTCAENIVAKKIISNPVASQIMQDSWQLFRMPIPTDEMSLMTLQGATYSFVSALLMQSYSKLYQFELDINPSAAYHLTTQTTHTHTLPKNNSLPSSQTETGQAETSQTKTNSELTRNHQRATNDDKQALYAIQAKLLIDQFYFDNWTIRQLAKKVHTNECYLKRDFKRLTGLTIANYRNQVRMQKALKLLAKELKTIEIANQLGFNSHDYFLKSFKKYYQCLPHEYYKNKIKQ